MVSVCDTTRSQLDLATQLLQHSWLKRVEPDNATQLNSISPEITNSASDEEWANELVTRNFPAVMNGLKHRRNATKSSTTIIEIETLMMHENNNFYECLMDATYTKYYNMYNAKSSFISIVSGSYSEFLKHLDLDRWLLYRKKNQANKSKDTPSYAPTVVRALETLHNMHYRTDSTKVITVDKVNALEDINDPNVATSHALQASFAGHLQIDKMHISPICK